MGYLWRPTPDILEVRGVICIPFELLARRYRMFYYDWGGRQLCDSSSISAHLCCDPATTLYTDAEVDKRNLQPQKWSQSVLD